MPPFNPPGVFPPAPSVVSWPPAPDREEIQEPAPRPNTSGSRTRLGIFLTASPISGSRLIHILPSGKICHADAAEGLEAHGFCLSACVAEELVFVYRSGDMPYEHIVTPGTAGWLGTQGRIAWVPNLDQLSILQEIGIAFQEKRVNITIDTITKL